MPRLFFRYQRIVQTSLEKQLESNCFSRGVRTRFSKETFSHLWFPREVWPPSPILVPPLDPPTTGRTIIVLGCMQLLSCSILVAYITLLVHRLLYICFLAKAKCLKFLRYDSAINSVVKSLSLFHLVVHMRFRIFSILLLFIYLLLLPLCGGCVSYFFVGLSLVSVIVLQ